MRLFAIRSDAAARDPNIDMLAWASPMPKADAWGDVTPLRQLMSKTDKPVVAFGRVIQQVGEKHIAAQQAAGFPFLQGIEPTLRALNGLWFHAARRGRRPTPPPPAPPSDLSPVTLEAMLAHYGIALPKSEAVASARVKRPSRSIASARLSSAGGPTTTTNSPRVSAPSL